MKNEQATDTSIPGGRYWTRTSDSRPPSLDSNTEFEPLHSHPSAPAGGPEVERSGRTATPSRSTRRCERCGKLLARTSPNTRQDIPFHKICWAMNEEERVAANPPAPLAESPLKDLLW